jgi:hypothetical protein
MNKISIVAASTLFALVGIASAHADKMADKQKHQQEFCSAVGALGGDHDKLQQLTPSSTMHDVRAVAGQIKKDSDAAVKAADQIGTPTAKQFTESAEQLRKETQNIPENMPVEQVRSRLQGDFQTTMQSARALAAESGCPDAVPEMKQPKP